LSPTPLPLLSPLPLSLPPLSPQLPSLLLPPPQWPNVVVLNAAIAVAVIITHLFDTAIKRRWHRQWCQKRWLQQRGWWANDGNNGNGDGNKIRDGDSKDVVIDKEGDGKSGKSNDDGNKEGNCNGVKEGKSNGQRGQW
jgi:hypothetical protein